MRDALFLCRGKSGYIAVPLISEENENMGEYNMDGSYVWTHCDDYRNYELYECFMGNDYLQVKRRKNGEKAGIWTGMILKGSHSSGIHFINTQKSRDDAEYVKHLVEECYKNNVYSAEQIESMGII